MRLTIIPGDNVVIVDGRGIVFNLSNYPSLKGIRAIQWDGKKGHIEYDNRDKSPTEFQLNREIDNISHYQLIVDTWKREAAAEDAKPKEASHAQQHAQTSPDDGRSTPQPSVRKENGYTTVRGERVQPRRQEDRDPAKKETEDLKRRI